MTYILIDKETQAITYPPINKDNICNYNQSTELLENDGYVDVEQSLIDLFNQGKAKIINGEIVDISQTPEYLAEQTTTRQQNFLNQFFEVKGCGWYRKRPKGYASAIESLNTALSVVNILGYLPADYLIFYKLPNFEIEEQCTEEWLMNNQVKNVQMTLAEFAIVYKNAIISWNSQEHQ